MRNALVTVLLLSGCAPAGVGSAPPAGSAPPDPVRVVAEADRAARSLELWPDFDPSAIPVAIYDGERTLLFRHPSPPAGFSDLTGNPGVSVHAGRHPAMVANTSVELGGVLTATLIVHPSRATARELAGILVHEAFHVHQRTRHPGWGANEAELFTYPVTDVDALALRRAEWEALRNALRADRWQCHAAEALALREERFARLPDGAVGYERGIELFEGTAEYLQMRVTGGADSLLLRGEEFSADGIRARAYRTGAALARLLDRTGAGWREQLVAHDALSLDRLLTARLAESGWDGERCVLPPAKRTGLRAAAAAEIDRLERARAAERDEFLRRPGHRLILSTRALLFPSGFDPLNVRVLRGVEVLHTRFVRLGSDAGWIEVLGSPALTTGAGPHPLFNGVTRVEITGLAEPPRIERAGDTLRIAAPGISAELTGASVTARGDTLLVSLGDAAGAARRGTLHEFAWMAGCWEMRSGERLVEEQWMAPRGDAMPGVARSSVAGRVTSFEHLLIRWEEDGPVLVASPSGQATTTFRAGERGDGWVRFTNAGHDFPQEVGYRSAGAGDSLLAHISGEGQGETRRIDFPYGRVPCPGG